MIRSCLRKLECVNQQKGGKGDPQNPAAKIFDNSYRISMGTLPKMPQIGIFKRWHNWNCIGSRLVRVDDPKGVLRCLLLDIADLKGLHILCYLFFFVHSKLPYAVLD